MLKTLWHRLLSRLLEIVLSPVGITVLSELPATSNPPQIDILLLRRDDQAWTPQQLSRLPDGVRDRQAAHHLLECKFTESLNEESFQQALTYDYLYRQSQQLAATDVQTYVISAKTPSSLNLQAWGYAVEQHKGVYVSQLPLLKRVVILVLNDLSNEPHNEFLRLFASRKQVRQSALQVLLRHQWTKWPAEFWMLLFGLQKVYQLEGVSMPKNLNLEDVLELGEEMRQQVIASATPEERLRGLEPEERLHGLEPEELQTLLKQLELYLGSAATQASVAPIAAITEQRSTLIRVLQRKFGSLPSTLVQQITASNDSALLDAWLDQALQARTLAEVSIDS